MTASMSARLVVLVGSSSDLPVVEGVAPLCERFGISYRVEVASAHRQPARLQQIVRESEQAGAEVFVAVAGMAAHLPGVVASLTGKPVIGVPVASGPLAGVDALLSMVQMPPGVPVATVAVGSAGARNAVVLAARILALKDPAIAAALAAYRETLAGGGA
ncbi:MAG TPA: 5-(carboxyamino)imidazole ribonucleotide mutase [Candidatus Krumholzibacteria bacterium]|nr:5-(carboxyamino)imidazole ribonucleotide mutase [Candidatus Krumholzibacteria bacterium]HPD71258.1 5-(carboxyamino)imidazole ribonucleotide mutase [Candidatus Krumholzibacteria bacterium]HRY39042.1 5-(carboxyamino)imidazole ribonucleotide mutase [Candidatus Krumholzibacteria bacterium]